MYKENTCGDIIVFSTPALFNVVLMCAYAVSRYMHDKYLVP